MIPPSPPADAAARTDPDRGALLRREVGALRASERRRKFPVVLHVGVLGGERTTLEVPRTGPLSALDAATAFDLLDCRLGSALPGEVDAWLTRPGVASVHDHDLLWLPAATAAVAARGAVLRSFHAVTRSGWLDVRTGETRVWKRLRLDR